VVSDPTQDGRDVYGALRHVVHDDHDVSRQLLEAGAARLFDAEPPITRAREYAATAENARAHQRRLRRAC
jgi:endonuclease YncB( thermonuclease family)